MRGTRVFPESGLESRTGWAGVPAIIPSCLQASAQGDGLLPVPGASPAREPLQDHPVPVREAVQQQRPAVRLVSGGAGGAQICHFS